MKGPLAVRFFFFNDPAPTEIYTLSLHDALPICRVDATSLSIGTWITIQKEPGVRILVDHNTYFENATVVEKVNAATTKVIDEKPEQLRRFTAAIIKASRYFAENQDAWVSAVTKRRPDVDRNDAASLWNGFRT